MSDTSKPQNGASSANPEPQVRILAQFIKDLSFENRSAGRVAIEPDEQPNIRVEVNVNAQNVAPNVYESVTTFNALCTVKGGTLYECEVEYGAAVQLEHVPPQSLEPFLLINCPALTFPFLRRLVADITREGGYPPLLLDPIDFASLYVKRQQQGGESKLS